MRTRNGFTLVEMVMVIALMGVVLAALAPITLNPFRTYDDLRRRAELVMLAENALQNMARDIRSSLPNSIRINGSALELLHVSGGGRYRAQESDQSSSDPLDFTQADSSFQVFGSMSTPASGSRLVIYHTGQNGADAYSGNSVITPASTSITVTSGTSESVVTLSTAHQFAWASPQQRFYIVDTPVTYRCSGGQLNRYDSYSIQSTTASPPVSARSARVTDLISACTFTYQPGTPQRSAIVTLDLTLAKDNEQVRLLEQINVPNGI